MLYSFEKDHRIFTVIANYEPLPSIPGLPLRLGDLVVILSESQEWYYGSQIATSASASEKRGIFPKSFVRKCKNFQSNGLFNSSLNNEIEVTLTQWNCIRKNLYEFRLNSKLSALESLMDELLGLRKSLQRKDLTVFQRRELKLIASRKLDLGNKVLERSTAIRSEEGDPLNSKTHGLIQFLTTYNTNIKKSRSESLMLSDKTSQNPNCHILVSLQKFFWPYEGEILQLRFSLFSLTSSYISESVILNSENSKALFLDIENSNYSHDLYLIVKVLRIGKILPENRKSTSTNHFKRPFGVGVTNISCINESNDIEEFEIKFYECENKDFYHLHEMLIKSSGKFNALAGGYRVLVHIQSLKDEISQNVLQVRKIGFPTIIMPGDFRNDLYLTLERGCFERGGKAKTRNIEIKFSVFDNNGDLIPECIYSTASTTGLSTETSTIYYHSNSPNWFETFRLTIPIEKYPGSHVRLEYRHCSTKDNNERLFGFSLLFLMNSNLTTLKDGKHILSVYKHEELSKMTKGGNIKELEVSLTKSQKESMSVSTRLCSSKLTQNVHLMALLKWKTNEYLLGTLNQILNLEGEEIVKFIQDVLDALFSIFSTEDGNSNSHSGAVFHVLVSIFSILKNDKFEHFRPVLDSYIAEHFSASLVYRGLLSCVQHVADLVASTENQEPFQKCFRSLEYISKFIVRSRLLFIEFIGDTNYDGFIFDVDLLFTSFIKMLSTTSVTILETQVIFLQHIRALYVPFLQVLPPLEIAKKIAMMFDAVTDKCSSELLVAKLASLREAVQSPIFQDNESRIILLTSALLQCKTCLSQLMELKLTCELLGDIISFLYDKKDEFKSEISLTSLCIIRPLIMTLLNYDRQNHPSESLCLITSLLSVFQLFSQFHFDEFWSHWASRKETKDFLHQTFLLLRDLFRHDPFPTEMKFIKYISATIFLRLLLQFSDPLQSHFLNEEIFDSQLWTDYFTVIVAFISQSCLQLDSLHLLSHLLILEHFGDMRQNLASKVLSLWNLLSEKKHHFIPRLVGPLLEISLIRESKIRKAILPIFCDMFTIEYTSRGNFKQMETEIVDKLDILIDENNGDKEYSEYFYACLVKAIGEANPVWKNEGLSFVTSVTKLLDMLLDYRRLLQGDENRDKRMSCTVNLLKFYECEINRPEMYLRYIYKLHEMQLSARNYGEAGFILKLHADQLQWSNKILHSDLTYATQREWQRKELLYNKIIGYFEKGNLWEHAIPLCKELSTFYESKIFDYRKNTCILNREAALYEKIISPEVIRLHPEYFRVRFLGPGFSVFLRNKEFVYRCDACEKLSQFIHRISNEFPEAEILSSNTPIAEDPRLRQTIQICSVKAVSSFKAPSESLEDVPSTIQDFYAVNDINTFQYDRPFHVGTKSEQNEFKTLWIERSSITTSAHFPGILCWFEVISWKKEDISPIHHACESIENKNFELRSLLYSGKLGNLTQNLQGILDAAVNGGINKFKEAFFDDKDEKNVLRLKNAMCDQISILESALVVHERLVPEELRPLHNHLVRRLSDMKIHSPLLTRSQSIVNSPLPSLPIKTDVDDYLGDNENHQEVNLRHRESRTPPPRPPRSCDGFTESPPAIPKRISRKLLDYSEVDENPPPIPPKSSFSSSLDF